MATTSNRLTEYLTARQAAKVLGVTPGRVRQFTTSGELRGTQTGRLWLFPRKAVERLKTIRAKSA